MCTTRDVTIGNDPNQAYGTIDSIVTRGHCQYISGVALALAGTVTTVYNIMHTAMHNIQEIVTHCCICSSSPSCLLQTHIRVAS